MKRIIIAAVFILMSLTTFAKSSKWRAIEAVVLPQDVTVYQGVTKSGNAKYWLQIADIQVGISESNVAKLKSGECQIELVKWIHTDTRKYKYTTRQKAVYKETPNIDLSKLF